MIPYSRKLRIKKPIAADLEGPVAMALGAQKLEERGLAWVTLLGLSRREYINTRVVPSLARQKGCILLFSECSLPFLIFMECLKFKEMV